MADGTNEPVMQVEEVAPEIEHPEEIAGSIPPDYPKDIPVYEEKNSKSPFILIIVFIFILVFGGVAWFLLKDRFAPQPPVETPKTPTTLTYWGLWEDAEVMQPLFEAYKKENPHITVVYEKMTPEEYRERLIARSNAGTGPDIFRFHNTWVPMLLEVLAPIPPEIYSAGSYAEAFYPVIVKDMKVEDQYFGIPLMLDGTVLIYNDTLLKQAGFNSPPLVWVGGEGDAFSTISKLTIRDTSGGIMTSGMAIGTAENIDHFGEIFGILLLLNGGDFKSLGTPEAVEALQLYRRFAEDGMWDDTMPNALNAFVQGRVAMMIAPSWVATLAKSQNPDLQVRTAEIPKGLDNSAAAIASYWVEGVSKNSPNQLESWLLLKYLSQKESLDKMFQLQSQVRLFGTASPRKDMAESQLQNPYIEPVIRQAMREEFVSLPVAARTFDNAMNDEILQYLKNAINATGEGVDYAAAMNTAQQGVSQVLNRYSIE